MDVETLYDELYAIAGHQGPLDERAVQKAPSILALPRYAGRPALLVDDLENVTATVAFDTKPGRAAEPESASRYFQRYARRYFSIEASGQGIDHRRTFGDKNKKGTVLSWMNRGVIYRVAAGLLALWAETDSLPAQAPATSSGDQGFEIETLWVRRYIDEGAMRSVAHDSLEFNLRLNSTGPHILALPWPRRHMKFEYTADAPPRPPAPVLVDFKDAIGSALVFGHGQPAGTKIRIFFALTNSEGRWARPIAMYPVIRSVQTIGFEVSARDERKTDYRWEVLTKGPLVGDETQLEWSADNPWTCNNPTVGLRYALVGREAREPDGAEDSDSAADTK